MNNKICDDLKDEIYKDWLLLILFNNVVAKVGL